MRTAERIGKRVKKTKGRSADEHELVLAKDVLDMLKAHDSESVAPVSGFDGASLVLDKLRRAYVECQEIGMQSGEMKVTIGDASGRLCWPAAKYNGGGDLIMEIKLLVPSVAKEGS